jgi:peptidoglycan/xylan/chitin deacetylase (PgdA/CDA1 family)
MKENNLRIKVGILIPLSLLFCLSPLFAAECGDVDSNGTISIVDALMTAQYYVGLGPANFDSAVADVNADGSITIVDALQIAQYYVGLITEFSCSSTSQEPIFSGGPYALGGSNYVDLPDGLTNNLSDCSIACWVYLYSRDTWSRIYDFGGSSDVFMMLTPASGDTGYPYFAITTSGNGGEQGINATSALPTGTWQHLTVVLSGNTGILYINGQEVGRNSGVSLNPSDLGNTVNNYVGRSQWPNDPYLNANITGFLIYNTALSAADVSSIASNPPPAITPTPTPAITPTPTPNSSGCSGTNGNVYLTFDDGPTGSTGTIVNSLVSAGACKATFFVIGQNMPGNSAAYKNAGFSVQNHSYTHPHMGSYSYQQVQNELQQCNTAIQNAGFAKPVAIRLPYLENSSTIQSVCSSLGLQIISPSVDTQDWNGASTQSIISVASNISSGQNPLMHENQGNTVSAVSSIVQNLKNRGMGFVQY